MPTSSPATTRSAAVSGRPSLRALEEVGVVERHAHSERPLRFEYHLTEAGRDLAPVMIDVRAPGWDRPGPIEGS
ncbi:winged helix-turn-helix transcriptional regulator [Streptomyces sp. NPDC058611]|uniref:winged helix-turn-helix transcriptional regulator n=1 Tax=unclassified Streptomyces TaxID=2593676 RepID=UPI00364B47F1